jgi:glucosyl-3-phosphoglycerate synthase
MNPVESWLQKRSFHHSAFPPERLRAQRTESVSVCVPARETAGTIGPIVQTLLELKDWGTIDQVVVVDAGSLDGTAEIAAKLGAEVHQEDDLMKQFGATRGKGDAMWRSLSILTGDIVCFIDGDSTEEFGPHFPCGMVGPLVCETGIEYVKAFYRRPFKVGDVALPDSGGRVTELAARPLLNMFFPDLAGFRQPLAGEMAARRELLEKVPWATGYAIETALLIDIYREVGLDAMAQVDLDMRQNRHQTLADLVPMAYSVLQAVAERLEREGRLTGGVPTHSLMAVEGERLSERKVELVERPSMASLRAAR